jgi:hypothetical protein
MLLTTALTMEGRFCSGFAEVCEIKKDSSSHYPQEGCHPKNEDIEAHSSAKEYAKVQKRTILYIFVHLVLSTFQVLIEVPPGCESLELTGGESENRVRLTQQAG